MRGMTKSNCLHAALLLLGLNALVVKSYDCPNIAGQVQTFTLSAVAEVSLTIPSASLCTLSLEETDGTSKPVARSYDGYDWERSGGSFGASLQPFVCSSGSCQATLPASGNGVYTLRAYVASVYSDKAKIARFLESASFGATPTDLSSWGSKSFEQYLAEQFQTPPTWHRELFRRRANTRWTFDHREFAAHLDPCAPSSTWRRQVLTAKDARKALMVEWISSISRWQLSVHDEGVPSKTEIRAQVLNLRFVDPRDPLENITTSYEFCSDEEDFHRGVYKIYQKGCRQLRSEDLVIDFPPLLPSSALTLSGDLPSLTDTGAWQQISDKYPEYMMKSPTSFCGSLPALTFPPTFPVKPVFAKTTDGTWLMHDPRIQMKANTLTTPWEDGGQAYCKANRTRYCSNVPRTFLNEATCIMAKGEACRPGSSFENNMPPVSQGQVVCGSPGEVSNDVTLGDSWLDVVSVKWFRANNYNLEADASSDESLSKQRGYIWSDVAHKSNDQLRQRVAFALLHIFSLPKMNINDESYHTEMFLNYYDIFVRHAFGNYRDILREMSYSPLMAESLTFVDSRSLLYNLLDDGFIVFPDENYSREIMQLFTVGLVQLNMDGTEVRGPDGLSISTYDSDAIMSFARAWTGFERNMMRGNVEDATKEDNLFDPMKVVPASRDRFPKSDIEGGYIGDYFPLCTDLPPRAFLHVGAKYRLLGSWNTSENVAHVWKPSSSRKQFQVSSSSALYARLCGAQNGKCTYPSVLVLDTNLPCSGNECKVDTVRVVRIDSVHYEYIRRPCVELSFFNGKKVQYTSSSPHIMCANPKLPVAGEACCKPSGLTAVTSCEYAGERMTLATAEQRCALLGRRTCDYTSASSSTACPQDKHRWTSASCNIRAKIRADGRVALLHFDNSPASANASTLNVFVANWEGKAFPNSTAGTNNCGVAACKTDADENCICSTEVLEVPVFNTPPSDANMILSTLRIGYVPPDTFSPPPSLSGWTNGYRYFPSQSCCNINTVFEVKDRNGQTRFLRNLNSTVKVVGTNFKFRNPPHFNSLLESEYSVSDAAHETEALLDHLFYHKNTPPFLAHRFIQRFGVSNPSPRYILAVSTAFATGSYAGMGSGKYGDLKATIAAVLLDREARSSTLDHDPAHGSMREPILKVLAFLRGTAFNSTAPLVALDLMNEKIGQMAYEQGSVFSFFRPEYTPVELVKLGLVAPESQVMSSGKIVGLLNGLFSLVKYGLVKCNEGFGVFGECAVTNSSGVITYQPASPSDFDAIVRDLGDALTGGRLGASKIAEISAAMRASADPPKALQMGLQLVAASPEFHSTNKVNPQAAAKKAPPLSPTTASTTAPYKAVIHLALIGGCDSFNVLVPQPSCTTLHGQYKELRGGMALTATLPLSNRAGGSKSCTSFGVHDKLPFIQQMFNDADLAFLANVGVMTVKCRQADCEKQTITELFSHNSMQDEVSRIDPYKKYVGTSPMGRMADELQGLGYRTSRTSVDSTPATLGGRSALSPPVITLDQKGVRPFNKNPSSLDMTAVIKKLNGESGEQSGFYGDVWSTLLTQSLNQTDMLLKVLGGTPTTNSFASEGLQKRFQLVAQLIAGAIKGDRKVNRDFFFLPFEGFDTHANAKSTLDGKFTELNSALQIFVAELKQLGVWDQVAIVQTSDFGRTLTENSSGGTDHGWGGHYWLAGGSVNGGRIVGEYPETLEVDSELSWERGRYIPSTPWDSVFNGIAQWVGLSDERELKVVLPNERLDRATFLKATDLFNAAT